jgi:ketosteroid isomerase-like protein
MLEPYAEDVVFDISAVFTDSEPVRGHKNIRRSWHELRETWDGLRLDPLELLEVGDGRYVLEVRLWGKGKQSGAEVNQQFAFLYAFGPEAGKIARAELFPDVAAALAAAESSSAQTA